MTIPHAPSSPWAARIGCIVPSWNTAMEYELQRLSGGRYSVHTMRIAYQADTLENLRMLSREAFNAIEVLTHAKPDVICFGCTGSGFLKTPEEDVAFASALSEHAGVPTITSSSAVVSELSHLGATRISVATPYEEWVNDKLRAYFEAAGLDVLGITELGQAAHGKKSAYDIAEQTIAGCAPEADAIFLSCSNLFTLDVLDLIRERAGKPVITSNLASMRSLERCMQAA